VIEEMLCKDVPDDWLIWSYDGWVSKGHEGWSYLGDYRVLAKPAPKKKTAEEVLKEFAYDGHIALYAANDILQALRDNDCLKEGQ